MKEKQFNVLLSLYHLFIFYLVLPEEEKNAFGVGQLGEGCESD